MTTAIPLGTFTQVSLREPWPSESGNFTPWLAEPRNLKLLAEALDLGELQDQQTEVRVGTFKIDILAVDSDGDTVLIENQLEQTNHTHLGQLLTYLAGQEGRATVIWIAEIFREEHRAAIDWLNANTVEDFSFFAVELELWRIGDSLAAPRFNVVAKPNEWTKNVREATREAADPEIAERHRIRLAYWQSFGDFLKAKNSTFRIRRPSKNAQFGFSMGLPGSRIIARISIQKQRAVVGLRISRDPDRKIFGALVAQKATIESEFGEALEWDEKFGNKHSLIYVVRPSFNPKDSTSYQSTHAWMLDRMERFRATFASRIPTLSAAVAAHDDTETDEGED
jgi:Domain of unknown function (DUF4268)